MNMANINMELEFLNKKIKSLNQRVAHLNQRKRELQSQKDQELKERVVRVPLSPVQINPDDMGHTNTTYIGVRKAP